MSHTRRRSTPAATPGLIPALTIASLDDARRVPVERAFVALLPAREEPSRMFDSLRALYVAVRDRTDVPVCFVAPQSRDGCVAFVDAVALMPELVLSAWDIDRLVPGTVGLFRQYGARWLVGVDGADALQRAREVARDAGFRGAPTPIARRREAWDELCGAAAADSTLWGVERALIPDPELMDIASRRAVVVCEPRRSRSDNSPNFACFDEYPGLGLGREEIRNLLGINEIREPCG